jgi:hypothetical protein
MRPHREQTLSHRGSGQYRAGGYPQCEHEAFVMKLNGLRLNVAACKACETLPDFAKVSFQIEEFT